MVIALERSHFRIAGTRLIPQAEDVTSLRPPGSWLVSKLVEPDADAEDILSDWQPDTPEPVKDLDLRPSQLRALQVERLFLRNRRIVCGYEQMDRRLRNVVGEGCPPTWLTVGKWTALTIGNLLHKRIDMPVDAGLRRRAVARLVGHVSGRRLLAIGRLFVLGNREIFAQVAGTLAAYVDLDVGDVKQMPFEEFVGTYGEKLLGQHTPEVPDELLFPIVWTARVPLSDSMLRALHCYHQARADERQRRTWVIAGNLHLAAFEQHVAQLYLDLALGTRPAEGLGRLLNESIDLPRPLIGRPRDMLLEHGFLSRTRDMMSAAATTRFALVLGVGRTSGGSLPATVFAPSRPLEALASATELPGPRAVVASPAVSHLRRVWLALDRARYQPSRTRTRDWRNYSARMNYIANLFVVAADDHRFSDEVLSAADQELFLSGDLPDTAGIRLTSAQLEQARRVLGPSGERP